MRVRSHDRDDFVQALTIKIVVGASSNTQMLTVEITDEQDPYFIYKMDCSEQDYHILKTEQQIMVDFQQFPNQFVELLNYCDGSSNAFACIFEIGMAGEGTFKIV